MNKILVGFWGMILLIVSGCDHIKQVSPEQIKTYTPVSQQLYDEIYRMDSSMFAAFNEHNTEKIMSWFTNDLEFYHDKDGLNGYDITKQNFNRLFENNKTTGLHRNLVPGSLEVYPIKDSGAVETCLHRFCHVENGKDDCGVFKNIMIWKMTGSGWKVSRVISYDHK